ncbi:neuronal acetylcholine receptor subunit alpha-9-like precursor [Elysia marginata]|uniref:Neuronal acetylcholine receptor subunit alpha-9-like n=1 Tax=Elysia marginata TaxID=1093978 RepID=A0AAV4GZA7_9GAST|nr:neuronal acetylcholine receptor subunit alpha-9-like precursor [Elysia marginata]
MEEKIWRSSRILPLLIYTALLSSNGVVCTLDIHSLTGPEHKLYLDLFKSYNMESRPVKNASHSVSVTFALGLNQLLDLDEKNQVLTTSVWIYEEWQDEMLTWSPNEYDGQSALMIPSSSIWLPDIFIFNTAGPNMNGFVNVNGSKVAIRYDGNVKWMVPLMVASACAVDVTYFPYDRQSCEIKFGSWIYDIDQVDIRIDSDIPDLEHYVMNSDSCCPGNGRHPMVGLKVNLRRKSLYYDYIVIAPTIMLCVMTLASFLLPCDRGEKMNIGLTVFLTLYVLQLRIADNVPDTNSTPILGVFMLVVMTFNCVSLIMATIVMNIKKLGDDSPCPDVPRWLFVLCHHVLGRVVCTPYLWAGDSRCSSPSACNSKSQNLTERETEGMVDITSHQPPHVNASGVETDTTPNTLERSTDCGQNSANLNDATKVSSTRAQCQNQCDPKQGNASPQDLEKIKLNDNTHGTENSNDEETLCKFEPVELSAHGEARAYPEKIIGMRRRRQPGSHGPVPPTAESSEGTNRTFWPLYDHKGQDLNQDIRMDNQVAEGFLMKRRWFYVAEVVDKFLFVIYLVLLTCSIFTVLFLIPVYFRTD